MSLGKIQSFLDCFEFESMFDKETLYDVLVQVLITLTQEGGDV